MVMNNNVSQQGIQRVRFLNDSEEDAPPYAAMVIKSAAKHYTAYLNEIKATYSLTDDQINPALNKAADQVIELGIVHQDPGP